MSFPSASAPVATLFASSITSMAVTMPTTVSVGDRLLAWTSVRYSSAWSTIPTGWSQIIAQVGGSSVGKTTFFEKIADGTEAGTTPTWVSATSTSSVWQCMRVTGAHASTASQASSTSGDYTTSPASPLLTPSWGASNTLWIEVAGDSASSVLVTASSTGYSGYQLNTASSGGAQVSIASAYRQLNASSENPAAWTAPANVRYWAALTIAVPPSASGSIVTTTQGAIARLANTVTKTQSATSRIVTNGYAYIGAQSPSAYKVGANNVTAIYIDGVNII